MLSFALESQPQFSFFARLLPTSRLSVLSLRLTSSEVSISETSRASGLGRPYEESRNYVKSRIQQFLGRLTITFAASVSFAGCGQLRFGRDARLLP